MRRFALRPVPAALASLCLVLPAAAAAAGCSVSSAYDLTVTHEVLVFERVQGKSRRIEMQGGTLSDGGRRVVLERADRERVLRFERGVRALLPQLRALGLRAVDLMALAVREEAQATSPRSAADPQLNARLDRRVAELKARISESKTSSEWRGPALERYVAGALVDVAPLIGGDLARQALEATFRGEFSRAAALGERAAGVRGSLERRIRARLAPLQPHLDALCPALRRLDALEARIKGRLADGRRLELIEVRS